MSWACSSRSAFAASVASRTASRAMDTANSDCQLLGCPAYKLKPRISDQNFSKVWCSSWIFIDFRAFFNVSRQQARVGPVPRKAFPGQRRFQHTPLSRSQQCARGERAKMVKAPDGVFCELL